MKIGIACLLALLPVVAFAADAPTKDKYLSCNCHITPGIPWKVMPSPTRRRHVHTHAQSTAPAAIRKAEAKKADAMTSPMPATPHHHMHATTIYQRHLGDNYPGHDNIISSNKLALPAGKAVYSEGELVYISGRVLDKNCVPVSDAIVEIWQTNPQGQYVKATLGQRLSPAPVFAGTGRATTDNLGRFNFVTVFPGAEGTRAPFIHVHIAHKDFPAMNTEMFFADDGRNDSDPVLSSLAPDERAFLTAKVWQRDINDPGKGLGASWDISLNGKNRYRRF